MRRLACLMLLAAGVAARPVAAADVDFVRDVRPIFQKHCYSCHGAEKQKSGLRLDIKSEAFKGGELYGASIVAGKLDESPLILFVSRDDADLLMPPEGDRLSATEIATLTKWVEAGAIWPDGVDLATLEDRRDHWSFKPVQAPDIPEIAAANWPRTDLDRFILSRLEREGLRPAPEADRVTWLRRVSFDLIGLPPTPEQVDAFVNDRSDGAYERVVDALLASPRYGERWAQHWLDVVRYADTHGFEVNTERPHAWPYRDYVIEAFNRDTPYDRFVREQIVGDALGADAATGFLITASVLLPGQIGADDASKRLARQDALDEIVVNIGQTFLGLSVGCARCHDHKFDPISQREYFAMQAFVAGVEYADRELHTPEAAARRKSAEPWQARVAEIDRELARFVPPARVASEPRRRTDAKQNEEVFPPLTARYVRFTIHDANLHPTLGLIEPCIDEFEIFSDEETPRNVALASLGTKVSASGSRTSNVHRLEFIHDGRYGNTRSWMSDEPGRGWVLFELPEAIRIGKVVWGRDREGRLVDRLPTAYTLEAGESLDALTTLSHVPPLRPRVSARENVDRFAPVKTKRLRFTVLATNNLEPCLDEVEIFDADANNVALASAGARVTSSGNTVVADRHELHFVHDGVYGNSRSWMSNETGKGWVEFEFPEARVIDRVAWGRDREGKFSDRLAIDYRIEVMHDSGEWQLVADASDRVEFTEGDAKSPPASLAGLSGEEARAAGRLLDEKKQLEARIVEATKVDLAFAGNFRKPDLIRLLRRGDPEQPLDEVSPAVPDVLGALEMTGDLSEPQRRTALADWIVRPDNPLTARVMVNRLWQGHFGVGLVETPNDFGRNGVKPTHTELLDWLADEFVRSNWSIKRLHRLMVLSATYRQSARYDAAAAAKDADARWLWRYPPRRLEGEAIRDAMLSVSGRLNLKTGGPGFNLFDKRGGLTGFNPIESFTDEGLRRMIYAHKVRRERDAVFGAFDCPDAGQSTAPRRESTTPIQALNLFNSRFTIDQSAAFAARVTSEAGDDLDAQIRRAYRLALNREPSRTELEEAAPVVMEHGLALLCRVLFNSNEFLFLP